MEIFLRMGMNNLNDSTIGAECHKFWKLFERNHIDSGNTEALNNFYKKLLIKNRT